MQRRKLPLRIEECNKLVCAYNRLRTVCGLSNCYLSRSLRGSFFQPTAIAHPVVNGGRSYLEILSRSAGGRLMPHKPDIASRGDTAQDGSSREIHQHSPRRCFQRLVSLDSC